MSIAVGPAAQEHAVRRERRRVEARALDRRHRLLSWARLAVFLVGLAGVWAVWRAWLTSALWLLLPAAAFGVLMAVHNRVLQGRQRARRAVGFHQAALDRLEHRWAGRGRTGRRFLREEHPYAGELDIFDRGGLFELLCTARTSAGEETLAAWLQDAAPPAVIRSRQAAIDELRPGLDLREDLAILGADVEEQIHPEALVRWCEEPSTLPGPAWARVVRAVTGLTVLSVIVTAAAGWPWSAVLPALALEAAVAGWLRHRVRDIVDRLARPGRELALLSSILARVEQERFRAPHLVELCRSLEAAGRPPSRQVRQLTYLVNALDWRRNTFFAPVAALLLWATNTAFAVESWRRQAGPSVAGWLRAVGELEALAALAGYAYEHPDDPFPEISTQAPMFAGEGLGHPLIPEDACVRNDVHLDDRRRLVVVSGSNMSGKTTLLRTAGINAVLAQAGAPVRARRLRLSPLQVGASVRHQDSIQAGHSRFYAEILRIRRLVALAATGEVTVLFLLDEILHGTNSHDRRIGAEAIVRGLLARNAIGMVTTHDLALAGIADDPEMRAVNVHFEDQVVDGRMQFDYRMRPGVVRKSNALELMRSVGLEV